MKKIIIKMIAAIMLTVFAVSMAACGEPTVYETYAEQGYTVKVKYDVDGALINDTQDVAIVEVFNEKDVVTVNGKTGIQLLEPKSGLRGEGVFKLSKDDGENTYYQVGWYTKRTPRVDSNGKALDAYGQLTSESGRPQAYVYEGKWDFNNDLVDPKSLTNGEMTLYAAWVPAFTYEFYMQNESNEFERIGTAQKFKLLLPKWNERREKFDMKDFPEVEGMEFSAAYLDEALTEQLTESFDAREVYIDEAKGISTSSVVKIYVTYTEKTVETDTPAE